jgi:hypothetical protein
VVCLRWRGQVAREDFALAAKLRDEVGEQRAADVILATYKQIQAAVEDEDFEEAVRLGPALARQILAQSQSPPEQRRLLLFLGAEDTGGGGRGGSEAREATEGSAAASVVTVNEFGGNVLEMLPEGYRLFSEAPDAVAWSPSGHFVGLVSRRADDGDCYVIISSAADGQLMASLRVSAWSRGVDARAAAGGGDEVRVSSLQWSPCGRYLTWLQVLDGQRALMSHAFAPTGSTQWGGPRTRPLVQASNLTYSHVNDLSGRVVAAVECEAETLLSLVDADPQAEVPGVTSWLPLIPPGVQNIGLHCPVAAEARMPMLAGKRVVCVEMVRDDPKPYLAAAADSSAPPQAASDPPSLEWIPRVSLWVVADALAWGAGGGRCLAQLQVPLRASSLFTAGTEAPAVARWQTGAGSRLAVDACLLLSLPLSNILLVFGQGKSRVTELDGVYTSSGALDRARAQQRALKALKGKAAERGDAGLEMLEVGAVVVGRGWR